MGTIVPPDLLDLDDTKFYRVWVDVFSDYPGPTSCGSEFIERAECCIHGGHIAGILSGNFECVGGYEFCYASFSTAQRLINVHGPYDTYEECMGWL